MRPLPLHRITNEISHLSPQHYKAKNKHFSLSIVFTFFSVLFLTTIFTFIAFMVFMVLNGFLITATRKKCRPTFTVLP